ncbi:glycoside hydrolase family 75 protein [Streptomyces sp. NPDC001743]|uniref:glycoside hydrolase family 75 protein n=1 Tax=Streptomyces sp. NPDC001743 TaxID=3154397 RepID=UPI003323BD17
MRTLALVTVSGAALLGAGSLTPSARNGSAFPPDASTPVVQARPAPVHLSPAAHARPVPGPAPAVGRAFADAGEGAVGAAELLDKVSGCERISNGFYRTDAGSPAAVPVCGMNGAVFWKAGMDVDCDGRVTKECNADTDPGFQGDTAFHTSDDRPLDARNLAYVVVPSRSTLWDFGSAGIKGGGVVAVVHAGRVEYAVVGDTGPAGIIGEASYATAEALGVDPDPKAGGAGSGVTYILFKDSVVSPIESHGAAVTAGEAFARDFLRTN